MLEIRYSKNTAWELTTVDSGGHQEYGGICWPAAHCEGQTGNDRVM